MASRGGARIQAHDWGFTYPGRKKAALIHVNLEVSPGELVVLLGPSGSGKSTLLRALAGTLAHGRNVGELHVQTPDRAPRIGVVQQQPEANIVMERVGDDVAFSLENVAVPASQIWPRVGGTLAALGLNVPLRRPTEQLSGGQQQVLGVAGAAVLEPDLLLLDEPTANLDETAASLVLAAVQAVRARGCTVVIVEHRARAWLAQCDRVIVVDSGTVVDLAPRKLAAYLSERPDLSRRVWLDHHYLPKAQPIQAAGAVTMKVSGVAVADRLDAFDFELRAGEVVAFTGPPGSGKSTLLAAVAGLVPPSSGSVEVPGLGSDPWSWPAARIAQSFGIVFQDPEHQFLTDRCDAELMHGLLSSGLAPDQALAQATEMLTRLNLVELAAANPFSLSGGQQRRLSVGTALVLDPRILILDEPTFGQDPTTWAELVSIVAEHRDAGGSVLMATHDPALVAALGARELPLAACSPERELLVSDEERNATQGADRFGGLDPLALMGSALTVSVAALFSDSISTNLALVILVVVAALAGGLRPRRLLLLGAPVVFAALGVGFSNVLLSPGGVQSAHAWISAALPASRLLAVALPGLVASLNVDPTALVDALVVRWRVPARAAYSVLAALRLLPLLARDWVVLGRATRARGLAADGVIGRTRFFVSAAQRLLVSALRRGARLAAALDARGLRSDGPRTVARGVLWLSRDTAALSASGVILLVVLAS